jgi:hypothetical protein
MSATRKSTSKRPVAQWKPTDSSREPDESDAMAQSILDERPDLLASVAKIMNAGLELAGRLIALGLFRDAVPASTNEFRNPLMAIERAREKQGPVVAQQAS